MNKKLLAVSSALAVILGLTACGAASENDKSSEISDAVITEAKYEEPAVEANGDAVADENSDIEEKIDGAGTTENTAAETEQPAEATFKPADGLSEKYADLDNRSFVFNGHVITLGKTTLQEMVDAGAEFKGYDDEDLSEMVKSAKSKDDTKHGSMQLGNSSIGCEFINITDEAIPAKDCVICNYNALMFKDRGDIFDVTTSGLVEFPFPSDMTREDLYANSGDPTNIDDDLDRVDYLIDSAKFDDDSGYKFFFENNKLCEVHISWLP